MSSALTELLPCPFCGGPVELERARNTQQEHFGTRKWWGVVCRNTLGLGGTCAIEQRPSASEAAAITRWNTRVIPAQPAIPAPLPVAGALDAERERYLTVVYDMAKPGVRERASEVLCTSDWTAASWSHAIHDRDRARAQQAGAGQTVAVPVAYADPKAFDNFQAGLVANEWMWAKPATGLVALYAAPLPPVSQAVAYAIFAENGNCRIWFGDYASATSWAVVHKVDPKELVPLYRVAPMPPQSAAQAEDAK